MKAEPSYIFFNTTKGFQMIFPNKDFGTSNSTQVVTRLPEHFPNQGFQELVTQPMAINIVRTNQKKKKGKTPTTPCYPGIARLGKSTINLGNPPCQ